MCILISGDTTEIEWNLVSTLVGYQFKFNPKINMFFTDIVPTFLAFACTALVIHMNGYVGVLDLHNMQEHLVVKRKGGKVRTNLEQEIYELDNIDNSSLAKRRVSRAMSLKTPRLWCNCGH